MLTSCGGKYMNDKDIIKTIDKIVWWIPIRKLRDKLRIILLNKLKEKNL